MKETIQLPKKAKIIWAVIFSALLIGWVVAYLFVSLVIASITQNTIVLAGIEKSGGAQQVVSVDTSTLTGTLESGGTYQIESLGIIPVSASDKAWYVEETGVTYVPATLPNVVSLMGPTPFLLILLTIGIDLGFWLYSRSLKKLSPPGLSGRKVRVVSRVKWVLWFSEALAVFTLLTWASLLY